MDSELLAVLGIVLAAIIGFVSKAIYDVLASPHLRISRVSPPFTVGRRQQVGPMVPYHAYRISVVNEQWPLLNEAGENCVPWLELDNAQERYLLSWVGRGASADINVGDEQSVDFLAIDPATRDVVASTERGLFNPDCRDLGKPPLAGTIVVTCSNGKRAESQFKANWNPQSGGLEIRLEDC